MDAAHGNVKSRVLPHWMTASEDQSRAQAAKPKTWRRKANNQPEKCVQGQSKCSSWIFTVYCMNEAELVGMALSILNSDTGYNVPKNSVFLEEQREESTKSPMVGNKVIEVSPPRKCPTSLGETTCPSPRNGTGSQDEEDDSLKFVREIFFK
ncbi:cell cycle regulator of non-homologous end joining [Microcaecilia unicolor]|uniref:Cell cycle regulator of non-homologous end joining n=1 Tax=Microcaecilia unicolor TaxID=1415580 RepID=A0A6P7Z219_9AMPH|nr:cell cycle regulator of non-homologous end joining [Microcaecilia unicolor]